jgi:hypothetical protein
MRLVPSRRLAVVVLGMKYFPLVAPAVIVGVAVSWKIPVAFLVVVAKAWNQAILAVPAPSRGLRSVGLIQRT